MKLFYYHDSGGNFGDDLNAWLWPRLVPELLDDDEGTLFVAIGSILDRRIPQGPRKVIFGTGVGYGLLPVLNEEWRIYCVRGPLTARALGLPPSLAITDPAVLVRTVRAGRTTKAQRISFIPHFRTPARVQEVGLDLQRVCAALGIDYIDPRGDVEEVLSSIEGSGKVVAEAMHGAIVADALRIPWVAVQCFDQILNLKWWDWCRSLGMIYNPLRYAADRGARPEVDFARFLDDASARAQPVLSAAAITDEATRRLLVQLEHLKAGAEGHCTEGSADHVPDPEVLREVPWLYEMQKALQELAAVIRAGSTFIMVDEERWGGGQVLAGRYTLPFLEHQGKYWGLPANSSTAIAELERLRQAGAEYIAFMRPSFWWLDFYAGLHDYLRNHYGVLAESERVVVFAL